MKKPEWVLDLEARYGVPIEDVPGTVYILHYDPPQVVRSVSPDYSGQLAEPGSHGLESAGPISHYVGWSQQQLQPGRCPRITAPHDLHTISTRPPHPFHQVRNEMSITLRLFLKRPSAE
jgi:hypothetical protein